MSREIKIKDLPKIFRAMASNQMARFSPSLYVKFTKQTGRGTGEQSCIEIAQYYYDCFEDYFQVLKVSSSERSDFLAGKTVLEYGPGDTPGMALLMLAFGAKKVICVDEFSLYCQSPIVISTLNQILESLPEPFRSNGKSCFVNFGEPASGFLDSRFNYLVGNSGVSGIHEGANLIISRSVLEHVRDLPMVFKDMQAALRSNGISIHKVDLKSHGLHEKNPLDFLAWPQWLWSIMHGHKGFINRWRIDFYRKILNEQKWKINSMQPTILADPIDVQEVKKILAEPFSQLSESDLSCLGFWLVCTK